jgi:cytochrome c oxidase cbb3-type subunit I/II
MIRPKDLSPGSIMPAYTWMNEDDLNLDLTEKKINAMRTLGVPYPERYAAIAVSDLKKQALVIATDIVSNIPGQKLSESQKQEKINSIVNKEIIAMIAYLQRLGTDIKPKTSKK